MHTWPYPFLFAHRGGGTLAPENTLAGMAEAVKHHFGAVEFDVKLSKEGQCYLLHDDTLDRTSNGHGLAAEKTVLDLLALDAGSWLAPRFAGEPVPFFSTIATYCKAHGLLANVEIKPCPGRDAETGTLVANATASLWANATVKPLMSSFSLTALKAAQQAQPALPRGWLIEAPWPDNWQDTLQDLQAVSLHSDEALLTEARVHAVKAAGYRVLAYTVNDVARAEELKRWGVDGLFTDALDQMQSLL
ncbi:glycerophosphodiester phosphodiesterase [Leeia oryzae]|uniref:glycerophosphodiester phosphodiesterase n=1 Tax=Leeia oryzae TaxID=356662 RepID=UPI0003726EAF|nr:glycerophosphodiester phosphodiesterase [Leeia oryzae]